LPAPTNYDVVGRFGGNKELTLYSCIEALMHLKYDL